MSTPMERAALSGSMVMPADARPPVIVPTIRLPEHAPNRLPLRMRNWSNTSDAIKPRDPPRRTLIDTFVERDDTYWQNRVDLKLDVPFTDHSHIIGRQGKNTQRVMRETGCHIHFPDSNKNRDNDKSNQVSIAGALGSVETARRAIRGLAPLAVQFALHTLQPHVSVQSLIAVPALDDKIGFPGLSVVVRINRDNGQPYCLVRGAASEEQRIRDCIEHIKRLYFMPSAQMVYHLSTEVMPAQQLDIRGLDGSISQVMCNASGATVRAPAMEEANKGATTVVIQGERLDSILAARTFIIALLPCQLQFSIRADRRPEHVDIGQLEAENDMRVNLKQRHSVDGQWQCTLTAPEYRLTELYALRERLCVTGDPCPKVNDYEFVTADMHGVIAAAQREIRQREMFALATVAPPVMQQQYVPPHQRLMPNVARLMHHPSFLPPRTSTAFGHLPPYGQDYMLVPSGASSVCNVSPRSRTASFTFAQPSPMPYTNKHEVNTALASKVNQMSEREEQQRMNRTPEPPRGNESADSGHSTQNGDVAAMLARERDAMVSGGSAELVVNNTASSTLAVTAEPVLASSPTSQATALAALNLIDAVRQQEVEFNKAPGHERFIGYEAKRVLAELAKAQLPTGGARAPTSAYSGYLFSNSMPQQMMSDRLRAAKGIPAHDATPRALTEKTSPISPLDGKMPMALPSSAQSVRTSRVIKATVPEDAVVHHTRDSVSSSAEPSPIYANDAPRSVFAQSSAMETMRPLFSNATPHNTQWQQHAAIKPSAPAEDDPLQHYTLRAVLAEIGLERLYPKFEENEVDLEALLCMNEADFETLGASLGARAKLRALQHRLNTLRLWSQQSAK